MITEEEQKVAQEIAVALNDRLSIGYYRKCAKQLPHHILRDALARSLAVKDKDVQTTRARIFTSIIEEYFYDMYGGARD
jgi:hypothetical protein